MFRIVLVTALGALAGASYIPSKEPADEGIVGGVNTKIGEYPYQLALEGKYKNFMCGASLIKPNVALTAAHCTVLSRASYLRVRAGSIYKGKGGKLANVRNKYEHPKYNKLDYDICVLILDKSLPLSASIQTISLQPVGVEVPEGAVATVTGWGNLKFTGKPPLILQAVGMPKVGHQKCVDTYKKLGKEVTERMACYGYTEGGKDACHGDSGGPIVVNGRQTGIVSWGYKCAEPEYPGVFAKISNKEITDHINKYIADF